MLEQPLGHKDRLMAALAEIQQYIAANPLEVSMKLTPIMSGAAASHEDGMDRTRKDAEKAKDQSGGSAGAETAGLPVDKLSVALDKVAKGLEGLISKLDNVKVGGGRGKKTAADDSTSSEPLPEEKPDGGGYINPYLARGLMTNPIGSMKGMFESMLTGGGGMGMKAQGGVLDFLKGTSGEFKPGRALAGEAFSAEAGGASQFMSAGGQVGAGIAVLVGSIAAGMKMQQAAANDRTKDAQAYIQDLRFGSGMGMDWRKGTWGSDQWFSRSDINEKQVKSVFGAAGVGLQNFGGQAGEWEKAGLGQLGVNAALNAGISNEQMGSLIGAGVRGGTFQMGGTDKDKEDYKKYLSSIVNWTEISAKNGISSADSLRQMAEVSQMAQRGTGGVLTEENRQRFLSYQKGLSDILPKELKQQGGLNIMQEMTSGPKNDIDRVMSMNYWMTKEGGFNTNKRQEADAILGEGVVQDMIDTYGNQAGVMIGKKLAGTGAGDFAYKKQQIQQFQAMGKSPAEIAAQLGFDEANYPQIVKAIKSGKWEGASIPGLTSDKTELSTKRPQDQLELDLTKLDERSQRLSGTLVTSAEAVKAFGETMQRANREFVQFLDKFRMDAGALIMNPARLDVTRGTGGGSGYHRGDRLK